jgi:sucrose-6-phosphate hydrolase SacC (GH32 family)
MQLLAQLLAWAVVPQGLSRPSSRVTTHHDGSSPRRCYSADGGDPHPCGPSAQRCSPSGWPASVRPVYHLKDLSCGESDPNGPLYHAKHGMYHLFYQLGLGEANSAVPSGGGPIWGHCASRDLISWAHLPVPMWNDRWYDDVALFSGSATIVDGVPTLVYPGLCDTAHAGCRASGNGTHHMDYVAAIPANLSDPLLRNWYA